ncbi:MAG TPA: hypothetical protein PLN69_09580 [bacterium]|nr:hypothetical protein [bacterium]
MRNKYTKTHLDKDGIEILIERSEGGLSILGYIGVYLVFNNGKCTGYRSRDNSRLYRFNIKNKDCEMLVESGKHILSHNPAIPLGDELYDAPTYSIMISDNHNTFEMIVSMRIANILYKSCIKENYNESDCKDYYVIDKIWKYYDDNYLSTISDFTMKIGALSESECESLFEGADP